MRRKKKKKTKSKNNNKNNIQRRKKQIYKTKVKYKNKTPSIQLHAYDTNVQRMMSRGYESEALLDSTSFANWCFCIRVKYKDPYFRFPASERTTSNYK